MPRPVFPIPEALGGKWTVQPGRPRTSTSQRIMYVPTDANPVDQFVRAHEMAHAAITPKDDPDKICVKHKVDALSLQTCEDYRVHLFLKKLGIPMPGCLSPEEARIAAPRLLADPEQLLCWGIAVCNTGSERVLVDAVYAEINTIQDDARKQSARAMLGCLNVMAHQVTLRIEKGRKLTTRGFKKHTIPAAQLLDHFRALLRKTKELPGDNVGDESKWNNAKIQLQGGGAQWHKMRTATAQLGVPRSTSMTKRRRWSDEGCVPVAMHRWATDQRMFVVKRRFKGGTLLLDASGSMHFNSEQVAAIVQMAPGATVAMYSGGRELDDGSWGQLTVIARNGMAASASEIENIRCSVGGNNAVDGPALEWLAKQPGPRVWMTDFEVNGADNFDTQAGKAECTATCHRAEITRVRNIDEATKLFAKL